MQITVQFLEKINTCREAIELFKQQDKTDDIEILNELIRQDRLCWANWLIVRLMKYKEYVSYAVYAAEQVIDIYEEKYPDDKRPRKAIEAAKRCIKNPSRRNKTAAAAYAADASYAAYTADAVYAAYTADAAYAASAAASMRKRQMQLKILQYGIRIYKKRKSKIASAQNNKEE